MDHRTACEDGVGCAYGNKYPRSNAGQVSSEVSAAPRGTDLCDVRPCGVIAR